MRNVFLSGTVVLGIAVAASANAQSERIIHDFANPGSPYGRLYQARTGELYGTTYYGGRKNLGMVFQLKQTDGQWRGGRIFEFSKSADGANPVSGVTADSKGVLYGTTRYGGASGDGSIYSLAHTGGSWTETVVHSFRASDGSGPEGDLLYDSPTGRFYGTASAGGSSDCGTAFELANIRRSQRVVTLYDFQGGKDGCKPEIALRPGPDAGILYGITSAGGTYGRGTIFELRKKRGLWTESVLYTFTGGDGGANPAGLENAGPADRLYGITSEGGLNFQGVVFELRRVRTQWRESVLYAFSGNSIGGIPSGVTLDAATGTLYGTTQEGGDYSQGTAFKLSPTGKSWTASVLHSFGSAGDGTVPPVQPTLGRRTGMLFGVTLAGGRDNGGTVWEITGSPVRR